MPSKTITNYLDIEECEIAGEIAENALHMFMSTFINRAALEFEKKNGYNVLTKETDPAAKRYFDLKDLIIKEVHYLFKTSLRLT